jgi:hypothetical protein
MVDMPTTNGVYTPLSWLQQGKAQRYLGQLLRAGKTASQSMIDKAIKKLGVDDSDTNAIVSAMLAATGGIQTASTIRRTHNRAPLASEHATINGDRNRIGQYAYTVLISSTDPKTGIVRNVQSIIYSPTPMSLDSLRYNVNANKMYYAKLTETPQVGKGDTAGYSLSTIILSAGVIG